MSAAAAPQPYYQDEQVTVLEGDCRAVMATLADESVDAVVTDPPYGLEFMGKEWDAPWKYGFGETGYTDAKRMARPNHGSRRNPMCRACRKHQRGTKRCECAAPVFDERPADSNVAFQQWCTAWAAECLRVLKPGAHLAAFGGTRTWHRLAAAIEDAGFEIRDNLAWIYGSGFPKSLDVHKAVESSRWSGRVCVMCDGSGQDRIPDRVCRCCNGHGREPYTDEWQGWGTALKPAFEPIILARKPIRGTVAANVVEHSTGALNIDACRVATSDKLGGGANGDNGMTRATRQDGWGRPWMDDPEARAVAAARSRESTARSEQLGRWPANVLLDPAAAEELDRQSGVSRDGTAIQRNGGGQRIFNQGDGLTRDDHGYGSEGGASRFFPVFRYSAKAPGTERPSVGGVAHPTVKPLELMRWLVRLITPPGGVVLDPFAGTGTTAEAAIHEHKRAILIEREPTYLPLIVARLSKPMAVGFDFKEGA